MDSALIAVAQQQQRSFFFFVFFRFFFRFLGSFVVVFFSNIYIFFFARAGRKGGERCSLCVTGARNDRFDFFLFYFDFDSYFVFLFCLFLVFQFIPSFLAFHSIGNQLRRVPWIGLAKASSEVYLVFFFYRVFDGWNQLDRVWRCSLDGVRCFQM